jgi:chlorobactene glucosyltransferase
MAILTGPLALYSDRRYRELPELPRQPVVHDLPELSIIVPARNEAINLQQLLPSLSAISYPGNWELIVVDDQSTDDTGCIARRLGAKVISLDDKPAGWTGKSYACHRGALAASGKWLLFTDADTVHHPCGPAQAVAYAECQGLDGLSIFFNQDSSGVLDRLALSVAFAGLFAGRRSGSPTLNGQYILLRRDVYVRSGGFSAVGGESLEDLALGHHLRARNYRVQLFRSDTIASVKMYADTANLWQGLVRLGAGSLRWMGINSVITALFITGVMTPILAIISAFLLGRHRKMAITSWFVVALGFVPWARRFGSGWLALFAPFGGLMVQVAATWGLVRRLSGRGTYWKGRWI